MRKKKNPQNHWGLQNYLTQSHLSFYSGFCIYIYHVTCYLHLNLLLKCMRICAAWTPEKGLSNCLLCNTKTTTSNTLFLSFWEVGGNHLLC